MGELVGIDPGYNAGIWLRTAPGVSISQDHGHVKDGWLIVIEIEDKLKDPSVRVVSSTGLVGWTFASRLIKLESFST